MTTTTDEGPHAGDPDPRPPFLAEFVAWVLLGVALFGPALWGFSRLFGEPKTLTEALVHGAGWGVLMGLFGRPLFRFIDRLFGGR